MNSFRGRYEIRKIAYMFVDYTVRVNNYVLHLITSVFSDIFISLLSMHSMDSVGSSFAVPGAPFQLSRPAGGPLRKFSAYTRSTSRAAQN